MKKLTREPGGQISCSSDAEIMRAVRHAAIEASTIELCAEPMDIQHMLNAWVYGLARLPEDVRMVLTVVLARELERWRLESPLMEPEELRAAIVRALARPDELVIAPDGVSEKSGPGKKISHPRRNDNPAGKPLPRPRGVK